MGFSSASKRRNNQDPSIEDNENFPKIAPKPKMLSIRMTDAQNDHLLEMIRLIEAETGTKVTKSSLVLRLIEFGQPTLENLYPKAFGVETDVEVEFYDDEKPEEEKKKRFFFFN